jgi:hypothetical protein
MNLTIERGPDAGRRWTLYTAEIILGRGPACDITLRDERASRRHARIWYQTGGWWVSDLGSANGTWVNRQRLAGPQQLRPGDQIGLGQTVISLELPARAPAPQAAPAAHYAQDVTQPQRAGLLSGLAQGLVLLAALLLVAGAWMPWVRVTLDIPFVELIDQVSFTPPGVDGLGRYTLLGGALSLALSLGTLLLWAVRPQDGVL